MSFDTGASQSECLCMGMQCLYRCFSVLQCPQDPRYWQECRFGEFILRQQGVNNCVLGCDGRHANASSATLARCLKDLDRSSNKTWVPLISPAKPGEQVSALPSLLAWAGVGLAVFLALLLLACWTRWQLRWQRQKREIEILTPGLLVEAHSLGHSELNGLQGRIKGWQQKRLVVDFGDIHGEKALLPKNLRLLEVREPDGQEVLPI